MIRSELRPSPKGLQWVITDAEGFEVLSRNATYETRYRYFRPGRYEVVLKARDGRGYADISERVSIDCP